MKILHQNLRILIKVVLRGKCMAFNAFIMKKEREKKGGRKEELNSS